MTKFDAVSVARKISKDCLPRENMVDMGADTWRKACKVLRLLAEENVKRWPHVNVYEASRRRAHLTCDGDNVSELIATYEEHATRMVNDPKRW
jgi:hypothetical protein